MRADDSPHSSRNIIEALRTVLGGLDAAAELPVVPLRSPGEADVAAIVTARAPTGIVEIATALERRPEIASVRRSRNRVLARIADGPFLQAACDLDSGRALSLTTNDMLSGQRYVVDFCDPNATKALHVGHLRNVAIGHALASMLAAAGGHVTSQTQIADVGHQMGEAMAAYMSRADGKSPPDTGRKGDHFVGQLYSTYVEASETDELAAPLADRPVAREAAGEDAVATKLMQLWQEGDEVIVGLWQKLRGWVLAGHEQTLARLGIHFDRPMLESDYFADIEPFVHTAVGRGVLTIAPTGAVVYETGDREYPVFPLSRPDGFPTQNLRALVAYHNLIAELRGATMLQVCGAEWRAHHLYIEEILRRLAPDLPVQPTKTILYGMVSAGAGLASSSRGDAMLIDGLLDRLVNSPELRQLAIDARSGFDIEDLAVIAALGFCLDRRITKPMTITPSAVLDPERSAGMAFVAAWARACSPAFDGESDPTPADPRYRYAVIQSQFYPDALRQAVLDLDPLPLVRFIARMSRWYSSTSPDHSIARVMRAVLRAGFSALGLLRPS